MTPLMEILKALECNHAGCACHASAKRGKGNTHCPVPGHRDSDPSCTLTTGSSKEVIWNCKGGCEQDDVLAALVERGLYHEVKDHQGRLVGYHERKGRYLKVDWTYGLEDQVEIKDFLYGLDEVLKADPKRAVFIAEGEKARNALARWGLVAVGTFGTTVPNEQVLGRLKGRKVYIFPDADKPGAAFARHLGGALFALGIETYRMAWPDAPVAGDAYDLLENVTSSEEALARLVPLKDAAEKVGPLGLTASDQEVGAEETPPTLRAEVSIIGAGSYIFRFPAAQIEIIVRRVIWVRDDPLVIYDISRLPAVVGQHAVRLDWGKINPYTPKHRTDLVARLLNHPAAPKLEWTAIVDEFFNKLVELETMGDQVEDLWDDTWEDEDDNPEADHLFTGNFSIVLQDQLTLLYGKGGDGKSLIALLIAICLQTGMSFCGFEPKEQLNVAYVDYEWNKRPHVRRLRRLLRGMGLPMEKVGLKYIRPRHPLPRAADALAIKFKEWGIQYAVIDSVSWATGMPTVDEQSATEFQNAVQRLKVGVLALGHLPKNGSDPFGSVMWQNAMRAIWFIKKAQETGDKFLTVDLTNTKANGDTMAKPLAFTLDFSEDATTRIQRTDAGSTAEQREGRSVKDQIVEALKTNHGRPMSYEELAAACPQLTQKTIITKVTDLARLGRHFVVQGDRYSRRVALVGHDESTWIPRGQEYNGSRPNGSRPPTMPLPFKDEEDGVVMGDSWDVCPRCEESDYVPLGNDVRECRICNRPWRVRPEEPGVEIADVIPLPEIEGS